MTPLAARFDSPAETDRVVGEAAMSCRLCQSENQRTFPSEINIHFPGRENLAKPTVLAYPKVVVCLDCGFAELKLPETELRLLAEGSGA